VPARSRGLVGGAVAALGGVRREAQHSWALWQGSGREWQFGMERCRAGRI
jgi:hypothetical protein